MIRTIPESIEYICDRCNLVTTNGVGWRRLTTLIYKKTAPHDITTNREADLHLCITCHRDYDIMLRGFMKTNP